MNNNERGRVHLLVQHFRQDKKGRTNLVGRSTPFAAAEKNEKHRRHEFEQTGKEASVSLTELNHCAARCCSQNHHL